MECVTLETILKEIGLLQDEAGLFLLAESIDDFLNKTEILTSLDRARQ